MTFKTVNKVLLRLALLLLATSGLCATADEGKGKIALLFLTRSDLNFPGVWQSQLDEAAGKYNVYIHSKEPLSDPFFKDYRIENIVPTSWSIHARAWQALIQQALKNPENEKFVFVSESCVPMYPLTYIYDVLMQYPYTYMAYSRPWWPPSFPREMHELDPAHRYGCSEWMVLNRKHAELVGKDRGIMRIASRHENDQEAYFPVLLSVHHCLDEVFNRSFTYANWEYATNNGGSPYVFNAYDELAAELIEDAYNIGCLFLRKVAKTFPEDILYMGIYTRVPE